MQPPAEPEGLSGTRRRRGVATSCGSSRFVVALALLLPATAGAKWVGDMRMCGLGECRTIDRHLGHDTHVDAPRRARHPGRPTKARRLGPRLLPPDDRSGGRGRPRGRGPVRADHRPAARLARNDDGRRGYWSSRSRIPKRSLTRCERPARTSRPAPDARYRRTGSPADPHSYLRLYRLARRGGRCGIRPARVPASSRPTREIVAYWERVRRLYVPITLEARRFTPWSDPKTSLWIGRRRDVPCGTGRSSRSAMGLAERIRRAQSLR